MQNPEIVRTAAEHLLRTLEPVGPDAVGIVLGTGLGGWADGLDAASAVDYADIPGFPRSTVQSHAGRLVSGRVGGAHGGSHGGRRVLALQGRFHLYEGYGPGEVALPVRVLAALGVRRLVLTNAAGALNPLFETGGLMLLTDHLNWTGRNPLAGPNVEAWGPRFPDMCSVYSPAFRKAALDQAARLGLRLEQGVYAGVLGPCLETPAETRALRLLGADAVGMSTVTEAIAARHLGMDILAVSCLTNKNLPDCMAETSLAQVIAQAEAASAKLGGLLSAVIPNLP